MLMKSVGPLGCESCRKSVKEEKQTSQGPEPPLYRGVEDFMEPVGSDGRKVFLPTHTQNGLPCICLQYE